MCKNIDMDPIDIFRIIKSREHPNNSKLHLYLKVSIFWLGLLRIFFPEWEYMQPF